MLDAQLETLLSEDNFSEDRADSRVPKVANNRSWYFAIVSIPSVLFWVVVRLLHST